MEGARPATQARLACSLDKESPATVWGLLLVRAARTTASTPARPFARLPGLMGAYFVSRDCLRPCALAHIGFGRDSREHLLDELILRSGLCRLLGCFVFSVGTEKLYPSAFLGDSLRGVIGRVALQLCAESLFCWLCLIFAIEWRVMPLMMCSK